ncbi:hypothetical protein LPW11_16040 [Geomonas sp. RF6]|uniref:carboxylesterase family protein n=1 Tax=Geomonas sp. RF6 TaxID=2897342 RepID=UPI001E442AF0|nr:hypothetical protein [Geomonas sp. RF6]UFS69398.1 hypothetical protein LPW11_16040 [Geomonas sp. RF6]
MSANDFAVVHDMPLPYLLSLPVKSGEAAAPFPVFIFLHGYEEGPPMELRDGITAHGPLRPGSSPLATSEFIVAAPQLPARGDLWRFEAEAVRDIVHQMHTRYGGDFQRTYLSGFSFGGNGVFDIALRLPDLWAALWPVDPTRVPESDPGLPVWLSSGDASRPRSRQFIARLQLEEPHTPSQQRVYADEGLDHVGTATSAYRNDGIYRWLLSQHRKE